jgi:LysM repeat protein
MKYTEVYKMRKNSVQQPTYALKQGESPAVLDRRFGFKPGTIASLNPGLDYNKLQIGQQLNMPSSWK